MPTVFDIEVDTTVATVAEATRVTGYHYPAAGSPPVRTTLILAHGAGAPHSSPFMTHFAEGLAHRGLGVVTFNFVYMERHRRIPDPAPGLEACYRAVIDTVRAREDTTAERIFIGGKSMGGRIATQVAAGDQNLSLAGLVLLGYPLHPPGRPEKRRDGHLPGVTAPMLFVQGSRDTFGSDIELRPVVDACQDARLHVVEGGDHSFKIRKKDTPPSQEEVYAHVMDRIAEWIRQPLSN